MDTVASLSESVNIWRLKREGEREERIEGRESENDEKELGRGYLCLHNITLS